MDNINKNKVTGGLVVLAVLALIVFGVTFSNNSKNGADLSATPIKETTNDMKQDFPTIDSDNPVVILKTSMGDISLELYMDSMPITAGNFIKLSEQGFYNGTKFHRVINDFMIQGGDPNSKGDDPSTYGQGGPGYTIQDEFNPELSNLRGTISMANIGQPNSGGSQFFINYTNNVGLDYDKQPLTSKHPVFGHILVGMEVLDQIANTETDERDLPIVPVVIEEVLVSTGEKSDSDDETTENNSESEES